MEREKKILILTAPSGAGKTSIKTYLMAHLPQLAFSISAATRQPRANEIHAQDYYFLSVADFQHHIEQNDFVEWEMVYEGKYYGTLKEELARIWSNHQIPVLDIDVKGALHVQKQYPKQSLSLFIEPPSVAALQQRLKERGTETAETLAARVNKASYELSFKTQFDKVVLNEVLEKAQQEALAIVQYFITQQ